MASDLYRRRLLKAAAGGAGALLAGPLAAPLLAQSDGGLGLRRLNDNTALFTGAGSNVLVNQAGNGELLIVDGGLRDKAGALLQRIVTEMGSDTVATLVNTHWHREQTGLNHMLGERGVRIFAHANTRQWLTIPIERLYEDQVFAPLPAVARPTETVYHYGDLRHGDQAVQYGYLRQAHTDGDIYVYFPEHNILHAGGVVSNAGWPLLDWWTGGWMGGLVEGYETLLDVVDASTTIVPANGPVLKRAELVAQHAMYATVFERVSELFRAAQGPAETVAAKPAREFEDRMGDSDAFVLQAHRSLIAHYTPDA